MRTKGILAIVSVILLGLLVSSPANARAIPWGGFGENDLGMATCSSKSIMAESL